MDSTNERSGLRLRAAKCEIGIDGKGEVGVAEGSVEEVIGEERRSDGDDVEAVFAAFICVIEMFPWRFVSLMTVSLLSTLSGIIKQVRITTGNYKNVARTRGNERCS